MKLLIVSYIYAPDRSPRAYRWSAIAEHWAAMGREVEVVAAWKPGDLRHEVRNGVAVHRVGGGLIERLRGMLGRSSHREGDRSAAAGPSQNWLGLVARAAYRATVRQVFWPDYAWHWYPAARRKARALSRSRGFDAVISVSHPFTPHLVGLSEKRRSRQRTWLVDVGDPFSLLDEIPLNNLSLYRALNRQAETTILEEADAVAVTVERCRADYAAAFPSAASKISVIPPLWSMPVLSMPGPPLGNGTFRFAESGVHLVAIGTLYRSLRDPGPLLALFAALRRRDADLHLHFFGALNDCEPAFAPYRNAIDRSIHLHGIVPREAVAGVMAAADILINLGNATPHQLPSKLVEYVASARPVLNLAQHPSDSSIAFLAPYPAALTLEASAATEEATVAAALRFIRNPPAVDPADARRMLEPHTVARIAEHYDALLRRTTSGEG